jgi:hypothetical protein
VARLKRRGKVWYAWVPRAGGGTELRSTLCTDKRAAEKVAARLERRAVDPQGEAQAEATVRDALGLLLRDRTSEADAGELSHETVEFYRRKSGMLLAVLAAVLERQESAPVYLREVTAALVDDYVHERRKDGVSEATIAHELTTWRAALRIARRRGLWTGDVDATFPRGTLSRGNPRERWLTAEEVGLLFEAMVRPVPYRQRTAWPVDVESRFRELAASGLSAPAIAEQLIAEGVQGASKATIGRRLRELVGVDAPPVGPVVGHALFARVAFAIASSAEWSAWDRALRSDVAPDYSSVRVRGSKNSRRDRVVPIALLPFGLLLAYALEHGDGLGPKLFAPSHSFRTRLATACKRAGIPHVSPNDLRRTHAKWLRLAGVAPANIAPSMGHADSRMVERVYGKASALELASVQAAEIARLPAVTVQPVRLMSGDPVDLGTSRVVRENREPMKTPVKVVPRDGIEPPTRGFSIPAEGSLSPEENAQIEADCPANVRQVAAEKPEKSRGQLEDALDRASAAGEWDVVRLLASEIRDRRLEGAGVVQLDSKKGRRS